MPTHKILADLDVGGEVKGTSLDLNGNAQIDGTITVGVDDTGYDVKFYGATSGSYMLWDESQDSLILTDNSYLRLGDNNDFYIFHDGTDSKIQTNTGDLIIQNVVDDKDIIFKSDDGLGGLATYFRLDGSVTNTIFEQNARFLDTIELRLGTSNDLKIHHNGSNSYIENEFGDLYIQQKADDNDIIFRCDDGSGGTTAYITLDGSVTRTIFSQEARFTDGVNLKFGTGGDMMLYHDGSNSYIDHTGTGDLLIRQGQDDKDIKFVCDDGSGGLTEYFRLDGSVGYMVASKAIRALDSVNLQLGASADFTMQHNGSNTVLQNFTGDLQITQGADDKDIILSSDDGSGGTTAYITLDGSAKEVFTSVPTSIPTRKLGKSGTTDGDYNGDVVYFGSTTGMEVGAIYFFNSSGNWQLADADAESTSNGMLGVALGSASDTDGVLIRGFVTLNHDPGTISNALFLSTTAGQATATAPSGNGDIVRVIGYCLDSTNGQIYFNPDGTFVEVSA